MSVPAVLRLRTCTLRPWTPDDVPALVRHADDREVWRNLRDRFPHPYTPADADTWLVWVLAQEPSTHWAIEVEGEAGGGIGFTLGEDVHARMAEVGYWLGRRFWGRGIATEALRAVTALAFAAWPIHRMEARVFAWNGASIRVLEKVGYAREACLRRAVAKDGEVTDLLIYGILRGEAVAAAAPTP